MSDATPSVMECQILLASRSTSSAALREIASAYPELWGQVASHPNADHDLLSWLAAQGDLAVTNAAAKRMSLRDVTATRGIPSPPPVPAYARSPAKSRSWRWLAVVLVVVLVMVVASGIVTWFLAHPRPNDVQIIQVSLTSTPTASKSVDDDTMRATLQALLDRNRNLIENVFVFDSLAFASDNTQKDGELIPVSREDDGSWYYADTSEFASYQALVDYVDSTYISSTSENALSGASQFGPLYKEINGRLCVNDAIMPNGVFLESWSGFTFTYSQIDNETIYLDISVPDLMSPMDESTSTASEPTHIYGYALLGNGQCLLKNMLVDNKVDR